MNRIGVPRRAWRSLRSDAWVTTGPPEQPPEGPEILVAAAFGDSIPEIKADALDQARVLYGPDAELEIVRTGTVRSWVGSKGKFFADVRVRCLNLPEEDR